MGVGGVAGREEADLLRTKNRSILLLQWMLTLRAEPHVLKGTCKGHRDMH